MSDPYVPPPRRPMPEHLERRISDELTAATTRRRRIGAMVIPLVAAAVAAAMVAVGATAFRDQLRVEPAETAGPVPTASAPTSTLRPTPTATSTPTAAPKPGNELVVRPMTGAEIGADNKSCIVESDPANPTPHRGIPKIVYAMVQRYAGSAGPESSVRVLLLEDQVGHWDCVDGQQTGWTRGRRTSAELTSRVPAAPVTNANGASGASCSTAGSEVRSSGSFFVGRAVRTGRVRIIRGDEPGPWMTAEPVQGFLYFALRLTGPAAEERNVSMEFAFLDRDGRSLPVASAYADERATASAVEEFSTCADVRDRYPRLPPVEPPGSDAAGIRTCRAMADEAAENAGAEVRGGWTSRLTVSTEEEWGAVLSDGRNLVGCSLYPTREISPVIEDSPVVRKADFAFALNPIGDTGAQSLWAAGRVPADVAAISYRLPGRVDVAATIDDRGYWMVKHHTEAGEDIGTADDVRDWPPVVVTVTRPSGTQRYTIPFTEKTMCRQVSHGC
jgi:hypothetical protein